MSNMKRLDWIALLCAGGWITASEFIRNELLFKSFWIDHYAGLKLTFETKPLNGILWLVWSFITAAILQQLMKRFSAWSAVLLAWVAFFPSMWITLFNLQVLPVALLPIAIPLSLVEIGLAAWIFRTLASPEAQS